MNIKLLVACNFFCFIAQGQTQNQLPELSRLSAAIKHQTYLANGQTDYTSFTNFINWLDEAYPFVRKQLEKTVINQYSLLYHWRGTDSALKPVMIIAHYDVVPAINPENWIHPPFSGAVADSFVWGRGALDDKSELIALVEAIETLLAENFKPRQSIYIAVGHDEEIGGMTGAGKIAEHIRARNLFFDFILDEGGAIMSKVFPGLDEPIAFIATAEKGYADFRLDVKTHGGHSSVPPSENAIDIISKAIARIKAKPTKAKLQPPVTEMLAALAPYLDNKSRFGIRHAKLFKKKILRNLASTDATNSLIRTTITPTMISSGSANNVLPAEATAIINTRIITGETTGSVYAYIKEKAADERIIVTMSAASHEPTPVSEIDTRGWGILTQTILSVFPGVIISPVLSPAMSDSRHYLFATSSVYRFSPISITAENKEQIHGVNERIGINDYYKAINFYKTLFVQL